MELENILLLEALWQEYTKYLPYLSLFSEEKFKDPTNI